MVKNVILMVFDTLRSDYLCCYNGKVDTPAFGSAADMGILFESAFGAAPGTPISHASLYSGQYPSEHGVTGQRIPLPEDIPVMAECFQEAGYDTFGITGPSKMGSEWGYERGFNELFETYYDLPPNPSLEAIQKCISSKIYRDHFIRKITKGGGHTQYKLDLIKKMSSELREPFFVFSNLLTVHAPYDPPRPYKQKATPKYSRPKLNLLEYLLDNPNKINDPDIRLDRVINVQHADGAGRYYADPDYLNEKEIKLLRDWYAASLRYLDDQLGHFLEFYQKELQDNTVLVLTADHGEQLGEHGLWAHSYYFYDETLNIPLIIVSPDLPAGERRDDLVSQIDIFDTLCDICGIDPPSEMTGMSVFSDESRDAVFMEYGERPVEDFKEVPHGKYLDQEQILEFTAGRKAIRTENFRFEMDSRNNSELYTVSNEEMQVESKGELSQEFRERIEEILGTEFGTWPSKNSDKRQMDDRVEENLRKLGYIE